MLKDPWVIQKDAEHNPYRPTAGDPAWDQFSDNGHEAEPSQAVTEQEPSRLSLIAHRNELIAVNEALAAALGRAEAARDRQYEYNVEQIAKQAALEVALRRIADIENQSWGGDYDEINIARDIANLALIRNAK